MFLLTEGFRHALAVGLLVATLAVVLTLFGLVITRLLDEHRFRLRQRLNARCQPLILAIMKPDAPNSARLRLVAEGRAHPDVVSDLVLKTLEVATGPAVPALRGVTEELGMVRRWSAGLRDRRWWVRAESARALGLVRETSVIASLTIALDDDHEEVRAAAVEALGSIGDPRCIPDLLRRLSEETRHQRARVVEALRQLGEAVTPALVAHVRHRPSDTAIAADLIGLIGGAAALDDLIEWTANRRADVRAAAVRALGTIGLDDRAFYHVLRALGDEHPEVRAMAARALGRSHRSDAAHYLAAHLDDEWVVAAHSATALRDLGNAGLAYLVARRGDTGQAGEIARQMLWECGAPTTEAIGA